VASVHDDERHSWRGLGLAALPPTRVERTAWGRTAPPRPVGADVSPCRCWRSQRPGRAAAGARLVILAKWSNLHRRDLRADPPSTTSGAGGEEMLRSRLHEGSLFTSRATTWGVGAPRRTTPPRRPTRPKVVPRSSRTEWRSPGLCRAETSWAARWQHRAVKVGRREWHRLDLRRGSRYEWNLAGLVLHRDLEGAMAITDYCGGRLPAGLTCASCAPSACSTAR
jgi:hypothetical protein